MMKKVKGLKQAHTSNAKRGMGDAYGSGMKNPIGKIRDVSTPVTTPVSKIKLKKPPKSMA
jgi:hypothetical protein